MLASHNGDGFGVQHSSVRTFPLPAVGAGAGAGGKWSGLPDIDGKVFGEINLSLCPEGKSGNSTAGLFGEEAFMLLLCYHMPLWPLIGLEAAS